MKTSARILVVEQDASIREFMKMALTDEGYEVTAAESNNTAVSLATVLRPDLIILDTWSLYNGAPTILQTYQGLSPDSVPILALSTSSNDESQAQALGAKAFLSKPFDLSQLLSLVKSVISRPIV